MRTIDALATLSADPILSLKHLVINTKEELYRLICNEDLNSVTFKNDFIDHYFTSTSFVSFIEEVTKLVPEVALNFPEGVKRGFSLGYTELKYVENYVELTEFIMDRKDSAYRLIRELLSKYEKDKREENLSVSKMASAQLQYIELKGRYDAEVLKNEKIMDSYRNLHTQHTNLVNLINARNSVNTGNKFISEHKYQKVIYVKELSRVKYVDTLIYSLKELMKISKGFRTRLVVIEPSGANSRILLYEGLKDYHNLTFNDLYYSDIFMSGLRMDLLGYILENPANLDYCIILDRSGDDNLAVKGENIDFYFTSSSDLGIYKVSNSQMISYTTDTLYIPHIENWDSLDEEGRLEKYLNTNIVKTMIGRLEESDE